MWLTLFQLRRRSISIPEKTVYSVRKYLTLPVQIRHPTQASFKIPILPRQGSNSAPPGGLPTPSRLRQSNNSGLLGRRCEGKGGEEASNR